MRFLGDAVRGFRLGTVRANGDREMNSQEFEKAMLDVGKTFASPEDIRQHEELTRQQKLKLLQQWEYDLKLLLVASEENMPSQGSKGDTTGSSAELMQQIHKALAQMGAGVDPEKSGPAKSAGIEVPDDGTPSKAASARKSRAAS